MKIHAGDGLCLDRWLVLTLSVAVLLVTVIGCGSKELNRSQARRMLTDAFANETKTLNFKEIVWSEMMSDKAKYDVADFARLEPLGTILKSLGLVEVSDRTVEKIRFRFFKGDVPTWDHSVEFKLNASGISQSKEWVKQGQGWIFPIAAKELIDVTGISKPPILGEDAAQVDYTWRWKPTRFGANFDTSSPEFGKLAPLVQECVQRVNHIDSKPVTSASQLFKRYDDGWRLWNGN